jgi:hypothetical protein
MKRSIKLINVLQNSLPDGKYPGEIDDVMEDIIMGGSQTSASSEPVTSNGQTEHSTTDDDDSSYDSDVQTGQKRKLTSTRLRILKRARREREATFENVAQNVYGQLRDGGYVLFIEDELCGEHLVVKSLRSRLLNMSSSKFRPWRCHA